MTETVLPPHAASLFQTWTRLRDLTSGKAVIVLDGQSLDIASVVAVARHGVKPQISSDEQLAKRLDLSVDALAAYLSKRWVVYGVNTGFGGSADTRTDDLLDLQISVLQHTQSAIITNLDKDPHRAAEYEAPHVMPLPWVRGAMVARANQNIRGHSAVRLCVLQALIELLHHDITPLVPLRGSISASGDLMPMSYIAGAVTGNPDVYVHKGKGQDARVMPSSEALRESGLSAAGLGPKEALGLINGTSPSVALASLVLYDSQKLAHLAQILSAFASESMGGNVEWAHPFIHAARPHAGQIEVAGTIVRSLRGSQLVTGLETRKRTGEGLWQDRYSTRTSPQWLGPYLEDLLLARRQLGIELNSTSDNPLVDVSQDTGPASAEVYSGGNFQAAVVTSAMDKTRLALQMIGRMLFSQVSEMIHPGTNCGLEANLNASDRENFTMKGIDTNMAAYMSELAALAHPVSSHVMSAEMHNQGINSLALISARRTMEAADLVMHMCACHIYVCCQAVDIRSSHMVFLSALRETVLTDPGPRGAFCGLGLTEAEAERLAESIWPTVESTWYHWNSNAWRDRIQPTVDATMAPITAFLAAHNLNRTVSDLGQFKAHFSAVLRELAAGCYYPGRLTNPGTVAARLGDGTSPIYTWVRSKLGVPTHFGIDDDPLYCASRGLAVEGKKTIGSWVTMVYESLRENMMDMVLAGLEPQTERPRTKDAFPAMTRELRQRLAECNGTSKGGDGENGHF